MRHWIERHQILALGLAGGAAFVAWELSDILLMLFFGYVLAAALRPAVDWLARHMPRALAVLALYAALLAVLAGIITPVAVTLSGQAHSFGARLSELVHTLGTQLPFVDAAQVQNVLSALQSQAVGLTASSLLFLVGFVSAIIVSMYLLYDWHELHGSLKGRSRWHTALAHALRDTEEALGYWARGQVLLSTVVAVLVFAALMIIGVEFAPVLAILAWVFEFVPYAGPFLAAAPAVFLAFNDSTTQALMVAGSYLVIQQVESNLLAPLVMRRSVDLHPVLTVAVMLTGFEVLGIPGVLAAVPLAVSARITVRHLWHA